MLFRFGEIRRGIENTVFDRDKAIKTYNLEAAKLEEMRRHNMSSEAQAAQANRVAQAGLMLQGANVDLQRQRLDAELMRQPEAVTRRLEPLLNDLAALQGKAQTGTLSQEERARLIGTEIRLALQTGTYSGYMRSQIGEGSNQLRAITALINEAKLKMQAGDEQGANEILARAHALTMRAAGQGPTEVPDVPTTRIPPR